MIARRKFLVVGTTAAVSVALLPAALLAAQAKVYSNSSTGVAINGYDPVAYFTESKPVEGNAENALSWNGATWYFSSAANKSAFEAAPEKYAPQYGGYCAFAVSYGSTASTVPEAWTIVDNKLYLNYSLGVKRQWSTDIPGNIKKANKNWPGVVN